MRRLLLSTLIAGLSFGAAAQITLDQADWPAVGQMSTMHYWESGAVSLWDSVDVGTAGAGGTYDFTKLANIPTSDTLVIDYAATSASPFAAAHPTTDIWVMMEEFEDDSGNVMGEFHAFFNTTANAFIMAEGTILLDTAALFSGNNTGNYDTFHVNMVPTDTMVSNWTNGSTDRDVSGWSASIGLFTHTEITTRDINVNGYGSLQTPNGNFNNVLRVEVTEYYYSHDTIPFVMGETEYDTSYYIDYYAKGVGDVLLSADTDPMFMSAWSVTMLNTTPVSARQHDIVHRFNIFPNPARDHVKVVVDNYEGKQAVVYNSIGQVVKIQQLSGFLTRMDVSTLEEGAYVLLIGNSEGVQIGAEKLLINK